MKKEKPINLSETKKEKEAYASPNVEEYGTLQELTQMPGGSVLCEGFSGKTHKKITPHPPNKPPC